MFKVNLELITVDAIYDLFQVTRNITSQIEIRDKDLVDLS